MREGRERGGGEEGKEGEGGGRVGEEGEEGGSSHETTCSDHFLLIRLPSIRGATDKHACIHPNTPPKHNILQVGTPTQTQTSIPQTVHSHSHTHPHCTQAVLTGL